MLSAAVELARQGGEAEMHHGRAAVAATLARVRALKLADERALLLRRERLPGLDSRFAGDVGEGMLLPGLAVAGGLGVGAGQRDQQLADGLRAILTGEGGGKRADEHGSLAERLDGEADGAQGVEVVLHGFALGGGKLDGQRLEQEL